MKNFLFLYEGGDPDWEANTTPEQMQEIMGYWDKWMQDLSARGLLVSGGDALHNGGVRLNANGVATDIAASEFKDLVGGYSIVAAETIEQAVELAKSCPVLSDGESTIQIREVMNMDMPEE